MEARLIVGLAAVTLVVVAAALGVQLRQLSMVGTVALGATTTSLRANVSLTANTTCDDNRTCTVSLRDSVTNTCHHFERPVGTACESPCYVDGAATTCDGAGECTLPSNASACLGYCESDGDCAATLPFNAATWNGYSLFGLVPSVWRADTMCHYNRCVLYVVYTFFMGEQGSVDFTDNAGVNFGMSDCLRFVDPAVANPRRRCLSANRAVLSYNMSKVIDPDDYVLAPVLATCEIHYKCAVLSTIVSYNNTGE